jgi:hypothetical protein
VGVSVAVDKLGRVYPLSSPSIIKQNPNDEHLEIINQFGNINCNAGLKESEQNNAESDKTTTVKNAIYVWLNAYATQTPAELKQIIGDPTQNNAYVTLSGVKKANLADVSELCYFVDDDPTTAVARIKVTYEYQGINYENIQSELPVIQYDVLLKNVDTASPSVVAWSSPANPNELKEYMNAYIPSTKGEEDAQSQNEQNNKTSESEEHQ